MHEDHDFERYRIHGDDHLDDHHDDVDIDSLRKNVDDGLSEETSAELSTVNFNGVADDDVDDESISGLTFGWLGLALSFLSFFWFPIILGIVGIVVGFVARHRDATTLGSLAIIAGIVSIIVRIFIIPFF